MHVERLHFSADRCGGNFSRIRLTDEEGVVDAVLSEAALLLDEDALVEETMTFKLPPILTRQA